MHVLILNCGSSPVKFQLIATDVERIGRNTDERLAHGIIERIGGDTWNLENYIVDLNGVGALELVIIPDISGGEACASLEQLRLA